jgi:DNA-3-methyladenine glycosylase II
MIGSKIKQNELIAVFSKDPVIHGLFQKFGIPEGEVEMDIFNALVRSIISQQLSLSSARAIYGKFIKLFDEILTPDKLIDIDFQDLRNSGLSGQKANYVKNVAVFFKEKALHKFDWNSTSDKEVVDLLTQIKGVGVWTAQMLLMFSLDRLDVFPVGDLGIRLGMKKFYGIDSEGKKLFVELENIANKWKPYRTIGSKLIWLGKDEK